MHTSTKARLVQLNAKVGKTVTEFVAREDDKKSTLGTAAKVAGAGALAYGVGSALRGRQWQKKVTGTVDNSPAGILGALRSGHSMNSMAAKGAIVGARKATGAATSAFVQGTKERAAQGMAALKRAHKASYAGKVKALAGMK
jgi:hypothetical protein